MTPDGTPDPAAPAAPAAAPPPDPNSLLGRFQSVAGSNPAPGASPVPPHTDASTNKPTGAAPPPSGPAPEFLDRFNQVAKTGSSVSAAEAQAKAAAQANLQRHLKIMNDPNGPAGAAEKEMGWLPEEGRYQTNKEAAMEALKDTGTAAGEVAGGIGLASGLPALLESGWAKGPILDAAGNALRNAKGQMMPWVDQETDSLLMKAGKATYAFARAHPLATIMAIHAAHEMGIPLTKYIDFLGKAVKEP